MKKITISTIVLLILSTMAVQGQNKSFKREVLIVDKVLNFNLHHLPKTCKIAKISIRREDPQKPSFIALTRLIQASKKYHSLLRVELGPEFWPFEYNKKSIHLICFDQSGQKQQEYVNHKALPLTKKNHMLAFQDYFQFHEKK